MPLSNYFNPNSMSQQQPQGQNYMPASGYDMMQNQMRQQQAQDLQRALILQEIAKQQETLSEGYGTRQAERGAQTAEFDLNAILSRGKAQDPRYVPAAVGGAIGEFGTKEAAGRKALGTVESDIGAANASNRTKTLEDHARELEIMYSREGPFATNEAYQAFRKGAPAGWLPEQYSPEVPKRLKQISDAIRDNPPQRREMAQIDRRGELELQKQKEANKGRAAAAERKLLDYDQALKKASSSSHIMSIAQQIEVADDLPEDKRASLLARAKISYDAMVKLEAARAQARNPSIDQSIKGTVGDAVSDRLSRGDGQQQPGQQQYVIGQIYKGRTGSYRYKGGPIESPRSWEKVPQ